MATNSKQPDPDVVESFHVLDAQGTGSITLEDLQTLYLALGFRPIRFGLKNLRRELGHDRTRITLQETLDLLRKHHRADNTEELAATFELWDSNKKGYIDARDVAAMSMAVCQENPESETVTLTEKQAKRLIQFSTDGGDRVRLDDFQRIHS